MQLILILSNLQKQAANSNANQLANKAVESNIGYQ